MSEISSLTAQVQHLGKSADLWGTAVNVLLALTALVGVLYFAATLRQSTIAKRLRTAQELLIQAKDRELASDLKTKDVEIGKANESAGRANQAAGTANERAAKLERDNIALKGELEKEAQASKERAEELRAQNLSTEKNLEAEKRTRLQLEKALAPRTLPLLVGGGKSNVDSLKPFTGTEFTIKYLPDAEATRAASNILEILLFVGWKKKIFEPAPGLNMGFLDGVQILWYMPPTLGVFDDPAQVRSRETARALEALLKKYDWKARARQSGRGQLAPNELEILVGFKPNPYVPSEDEKRFLEQIPDAHN